jgi:hypothetical protein
MADILSDLLVHRLARRLFYGAEWNLHLVLQIGAKVVILWLFHQVLEKVIVDKITLVLELWLLPGLLEVLGLLVALQRVTHAIEQSQLVGLRYRINIDWGGDRGQRLIANV